MLDCGPMKRGILSLLTFGLIGNAGAAQTPRQDPPWIAEVAAKRVLHSVPGMDRVTVRKDLTYRTDGGTELKMDVYLPPGLKEGEARPAVVFVHGGFLPPNLLTEPKEWGVFVSYGELAAASGFVGVTFNHRYYGLDHLDKAGGDIAGLIQHVRENAASLHVDRDRLAVWAFSGGGPFLAPLVKEPPPWLRGIVSYYAPLGMGRMPNMPPGVTDETLKRFSPVHQLGDRLPPTLIARAALDNPGLNAALDHFVKQARAKNLPVEVLEHPQGRHGFDTLDDNPRTREILAATFEFLKARLAG